MHWLLRKHRLALMHPGTVSFCVWLDEIWHFIWRKTVFKVQSEVRINGTACKDISATWRRGTLFGPVNMTVVVVSAFLKTLCQQELDQVLERISKMPFRDNRGPLEDLYALHIPNCDKRGQYNLKQVTSGAFWERGWSPDDMQRGEISWNSTNSRNLPCESWNVAVSYEWIPTCAEEELQHESSLSVQDVSAWSEGWVLVRQSTHRPVDPISTDREGRPQLQPVPQRAGAGAPWHGPDVEWNKKKKIFKKNCKVLGNKEHLSKL